MFTGIIRLSGRLKGVRRGSVCRLELTSEDLARERPEIGESIAVNGCCLTVVEASGELFGFDVSAETLSRTTLGGLSPGARLNLERALAMGDRLGGHFVTGHVDGTATVARRSAEGVWRFETEGAALSGSVVKGSVAVDGISLTVSAMGENWFEVAVIPQTLAETNLGEMGVGETVNVETDLLGKYVLKALGKTGDEGLTPAFLRQHGFA